MSQSREKNNEGPVFFQQENPFKGLSRAEINAILQSMGEKDAGEFLAEFEKLRALVSKVSPSHLLSQLSVYGLSAAMAASGEIRKRDESETIQQCHIEFIQALVLSTAPEQIVRKHATGEQVQQIWDLVIQLSKHFATQRFQEAIKATTQEERAVQSFQELLRLHTQFIRNWGYFSQVKKISYQLYEPLSAVFKSATGVSTTEIIRFFEALCSIVDERVNHRWQRLRDLFKIKNPVEIVGRYTAMTGGSKEDAERLKAFLKKQRLVQETSSL